ncbi:aminoglycoside phosphotransferase family protein [Sphaerisporangium rhizosphaerae]|uniref:Aminoglycoside phosphotransferase family protein n=1 Tax=Sphaerisporangium rhizosphaerae TaxID=2269375 RepID=A0ABW2NUR8_9ACTN
MHGDVVVKRFRRSDHDRPGREWRALTLLDRHAPGVAPAPLTADLDAHPPIVVMSRLAGTVLDGPITGRVADALADAVTKVQEAIPRRVLDRVPARAGHPVELLQQVRESSAVMPPSNESALVAEAFRVAADWVGRPMLDRSFAQPIDGTFGTGDGNLANYLWDGTDVRVVDFEYSGRSDRAFELAEICEHISVWANDPAGLTAVLGRFELGGSEAARLTDCRRLLRLYWLLRSHGQPRDDQASRLLALL